MLEGEVRRAMAGRRDPAANDARGRQSWFFVEDVASAAKDLPRQDLHGELSPPVGRRTSLPAQHGFDEVALAFDVGVPIARVALGQRALERRVLVSKRRVAAKGVAEPQIASPMRSVVLDQVQMVRPRRTTAEELPTRQAAVPPINIAERFERADVSRRG